MARNRNAQRSGAAGGPTGPSSRPTSSPGISPGHKRKAGHTTVRSVRRSGSHLIVTLRCTAAKPSSCSTKVTVTHSAKRVASKTVKLRGDSTKRVRVNLGRFAHDADVKKSTIKVTAKTGSYTSAKTFTLHTKIKRRR